MKYRLYVDEVGNPGMKSSDHEDDRFLCLTGVAFELQYVDETLFPEIEKLKKDFFSSHPDNPIIFHRKEMVNKKPPFTKLKEAEFEKTFNRELLNKLKSWDYKVFSVVIDKKEHNDRYSSWKYDPYHYCQEILIERFRLFLNIHMSMGDMMFETRGTREDTRLQNAFRGIMERGTNNLPSEDLKRHYTSLEPKFRSKTANISGLQVADLLAYPARRWFLKKVFEEDDKKTTFGDEVIKLLEEEKFFRYKDKIYGYGAKKLP
jgi:hypothetical protein